MKAGTSYGPTDSTDSSDNIGGELEKLLYKDLTYRIRGLCMRAYNEIGYGLREKEYRLALRQLFKDENIVFQEELYSPILINSKKVGKQYLDFLVEDKVVVELKVGRHPRSVGQSGGTG